MTAFSTEIAVASRAAGLLATFNTAGVLDLADVHVATAVTRISGEPDERVALALALAVRALRLGSVCIDLTTVAHEVFEAAEEGLDVAELPWPDPDDWSAQVSRSPAVADGAEAADGRPLRLVSGKLYLERYWRQEESVRRQLVDRRAAPPPEVDVDRLAVALDRLFDRGGLGPEEEDLQRRAAEVCAHQWVTVLAGGPGTGKTTTVAKVLAMLADQPGRQPRIALAAPTGKAAARLTEALSQARRQLAPEDAARVAELSALTLHRLLGWLPSTRGRFRHHAGNRLPYDVVVVDEMSMVSLTMMARLLEAVRPDARLVLVGDPDQLSSVEAGAVLADITGALGVDALGVDGGGVDAGRTDGGRRSVVRLQRTWRYGGAIEDLARAVRESDEDAAIEVLRRGADDVVFTETDLAHPRPAGIEPLAAAVGAAGKELRDAAMAGDVTGALIALDRHRLLCAHRHGPYGVSRWSQEAERWLAEAVPGYGEDGEWYLGRPLLITVNDYDLNLFNGDTGVVVATVGGVRAAFGRGSEPMLISPVRLDAVQTTHAMTVHRAQGSQFDIVSFVLPPPDSPLLTRELLYTAVTRASHRVQVFGTEEAVRRAVRRPANRASGLRGRLS
ncbi:exodeoxyribonuclease V alpha chain [Microlunatus phosphovorus NM-1]|uniref:RecBCD enzyme subunit RecD n=1 Tax=Microlunatus phosphovorus (strain ATCC 700054 / DSM 10555 / JCM 9379 / NBRC 101784 / NCIMB 13414 / VKM Ac-1990 / NM-1) TaxID=1032480 RepID=F5XLC2_MICPN|nr:exodeoxyribonuclease V subunit alpha [Microlunatus phosphovorus]BAK36188.1 exodeoxyribonuclease V alpha chain [Microlunatus phosphovorus NM-1]